MLLFEWVDFVRSNPDLLYRHCCSLNAYKFNSHIRTQGDSQLTCFSGDVELGGRSAGKDISSLFSVLSIIHFHYK
jgi:hypothetical protein